MAGRAILASLIASLAAAHVAAGGEPPIKLPKANEKWTSVASEGFLVLANSSPKRAVAMGLELERMRAAIGLLTHLKVRSARPVQVFLFADDRSLAPFRSALLGPDTRDYAGVFWYSGDDAWILVNDDATASSKEDRLRTVLYMLTRQYLQRTAPGLPVWLAVGLGEFYSTFRMYDDEVQLGRPVTDAIDVLRTQGLLPLEQLFARSQEHWRGETAKAQDVFHPQSWALVHYLLLDEERSGQLAGYVAMLRSGKEPRQAFTAAFGATPDGLQAELERSVRSLKVPFVRIPVSRLDVPPAGSSEPLPRTELLLALGRMLARAGERTQAAGEYVLAEALKLAPESAAGYALLGEIADRRRDTRRAAEMYEKAVALGGADAEPFTLLAAHLLSDVASSSRAPLPDDAARVGRARELLRRALELDPRSAGACNTLAGSAGLGAALSSTDLDALGACVGLGAARAEAVHDYVMVRLALGGRAEAVKVARESLVPLDPALATSALRSIADADRARAETLATAGAFAEARAALEEAVAAAPDEWQRKQLVARITELDAHVARSAEIERFNQAVTQLRDGDTAAALATLDALIAAAIDPDLRDEAVRFRAQVMQSSAGRSRRK